MICLHSRIVNDIFLVVSLISSGALFVLRSFKMEKIPDIFLIHSHEERSEEYVHCT